MKRNIIFLVLALTIVGGSAVATYLTSLPGAVKVAGSLTLANGGVIDNATNNAFKFTENSEDLVLTFGSNSATLSSTTGVANLNLGALPLSWTNGATIDNTTNGAITLGEASEDLVLTFTSNTLTASSSTALDTVSFGTIGVDLTEPGMVLDKLRFCGNGANATTANYLGPVLVDDIIDATGGAQDPVALAYGGSWCDANDNTTEGTADRVFSTAFAIKPVAMACACNDCGTNDTITFQLRDDTADVTGMTCNFVMSGAAGQCVVRDPSPATVAAGSTLAVKTVNSTDDDTSTKDVECFVYYTLN